MSVEIAKPDYETLHPDELAAWSFIPTTIVSDVMNRGMALSGSISPVIAGMRMYGQARTVAPNPGDNSCVLWLASHIRKGEVLIVAGDGPDVAMAGELVVRQCRKLGAAGIVIDGAVRDRGALENLGLPVFASGTTSRGPTKNFGGYIDVPIGIGGVSISPGDLIIADEDGVVVVPLQRVRPILKMCQDVMQNESKRIADIEDGTLVCDMFGIIEVNYIK